MDKETTFKKIFMILTFANEHSIFYKKLYLDNNVSIDKINNLKDFSKLPIVNKMDLRESFNEILTDKSKILQNNTTKIARTSGTTGRMLEIPWDNYEYFRSICSIWRKRNEWYHIKPNDKSIIFSNALQNIDKFQTLQEVILLNRNVLTLNKNFDSDIHIVNYIQKINMFKPKWMQVQPSVILKMIKIMEKNNLKLPSCIKYIELNGEYITNDQKKLIKEYFNVDVADMYGANEVNSIALENLNGELEVLNDNVYVELNEENEILITNLHNFLFPMIRYNIGDLVDIYLNDEQRQCLRIKKARILHSIILNKEKEFSPYIIIHAIETVSQILHDSIIQFKIYQNKIGKINIYLDLKNNYLNWEETIREEITKEIKKYVDLDINVIVGIPIIEKTKMILFERNIS
ncbi:MAG: hypothetical protein PHY83_00070 [Bacilli bacterium]|nr:hypothetical protein [Bacilli bacterium]MDD3098985.1 hypothetical protein [Bacilli bacterium]